MGFDTFYQWRNVEPQEPRSNVIKMTLSFHKLHRIPDRTAVSTMVQRVDHTDPEMGWSQPQLPAPLEELNKPV